MKKYIADRVEIVKHYIVNMECGQNIDASLLLNYKVVQIENMCCSKCCVLKLENDEIEVTEK